MRASLAARPDRVVWSCPDARVYVVPQHHDRESGGLRMGGFWDLFWWFFWVFVFVTYLIVLFSIIVDVFRDHTLNGWLKAVWLIFLIFVPFLTGVVYVIARGKGMAERMG